MADTCPTCGSPVTVVSTDEGTSHYRPAAASADESDLLWAYARIEELEDRVARQAAQGPALAKAFDVVRTAREATPPVLTLDTDLVAALRELAGTGPLHEGVVSVPVVPLGAPQAGENVS